MTFDKLNRRTHLYLGLALTPWFLLYAASGFILNHPAWFQHPGNAAPWTRTSERAYRPPASVNSDDEDALAQQLLADQGLSGRYRADFDEDGNLEIVRTRLSGNIRLTYYPREGRVVRADQHPHLDQLLTAAHFRAGFEYPYVLEILWGGIIDLLIVSSLLWIATGIYLWWKLRRFRWWGGVALAGGLLSFVLLALGL